MIKYIDGDLLETDVEVIMHQCNCQARMGSGIALQIKNKYPDVFDKYYYFCKSRETTKELLGECLIVPTYDGKYIANIFGQDHYYPRDIKHTDYDALEKSLNFLKNWMIENNIKTCGCPFLMSSALAGGDWNIVLEILREIFGKENNIELTIVKYNK